MRRILLILFLFGIVFSAKIDPEILFLLKTKKKEPFYRKGILKSMEPLSQISVLIVTKGKIWNNPIICSDKYCIYGRKVDLASLQKLASDERILSIRLPEKYKLLLWNGIPMMGGNLTNKTVILDDGEYKIPVNIFTAFGKNFTGKGVKIAIIDTGIKLPHPWFEDANITYKARVYFNDTSGECVVNESDWMDEDGHGTHVAGIIHSVAPDAELIIIKFEDPNPNNRSISDVLCAIFKAVELHADIISMSLGTTQYRLTECPSPENPFDALCYYVNYFSENNNTLFVVAAGNEGDKPWHYNATVTPISDIVIVSDYIDPTLVYPSFVIRWYNSSVYLNMSLYNYSDDSKLLDILWYDGEYHFINYTVFDLEWEYGIFPVLNQNYVIFKTNWPYKAKLVITANGTTEVDIYDYWGWRSNLEYYNTLTPHSKWSTLSSPGIAKEAITIGSAVTLNIEYPTDIYGGVSSFSSRGPLRYNYSLIKPEVVAPGEDIKSANNGWPDSNYFTGKYGTSMATPFVSGIAAIVKQVCPSYTPQEVKEAIIKSAVVTYNLSNYSIYERGYGIVNVSKLINEVLPKLVLNISSKIINTTKKFNISLKNVGLMPAKKIYVNNYTSYINAGDKVLFMFDANKSGKYVLPFNITGEFVNSPILKNITVYAYSNLSLKGMKVIDYDNGNLTLNISLENFADFEPQGCILKVNFTNSTDIVDFVEKQFESYDSIIINASGFEPNKKYNVTIEINCPYNLNRTFTRELILEVANITNANSTKPKYSFFEDVIINISVSSMTDKISVNASNYTVTEDFSKIIIPKGTLKPGNYTLIVSAYWKGELGSSKSVSFEILKPNVSTDYYIENTRNQKYFGINSSLILNISNNDLNFSGYLVVNNSSEPITVNNKTIIKDITKYVTNLSEGDHTIKVSLNFSNYFFANLTINLTIDKTLPNVTTNLTNYYPEDNAYYTNRSPITVNFTFKDNYYLSYVEINGTPILNTTEEENGSVINVTTFNLHYGENLINYMIYDLANNSRMGTIKVIYDNITPEIVAPENLTAFGEIELKFNVTEGYLKNFTANCTDCVQRLVNNTLVVSLNCTKNMTLRLIAEDKAGNIKEKVVKIFYVNRSKIINIADNRTFDAINKSLIKIESFFANESVKVNISGFSRRNWTKRVSSNEIRKVEEYHINITPTKNTTGKLTISVKIPEGYNLANVTLKKPTGNEIANYTVEGDYVKITIDLADPEIIVTFEKEETISTSTTSTSSTGGGGGGGFIGGGISGGFISVPKEYFNIKIEGNKITFERKGIGNKTVELNYTYLKNITIIAKEDTGYVEINELNISKILDIVVFKAYEIIPVNCSVILCFERTPVVLFNNRNIQENCVEIDIDSKSRIIFGRMEIKYKLLEGKRTIENRTLGNKTKEYIKKEEEIKEEERKSLWGWIVIVAIIAALAFVIGRAIILTRRLS